MPAGHSLVLSSSMANSHHIPGLIRGHEGTIIMVENGQFESRADYITVIPELVHDPKTARRHRLKAEYAGQVRQRADQNSSRPERYDDGAHRRIS